MPTTISTSADPVARRTATRRRPILRTTVVAGVVATVVVTAMAAVAAAADVPLEIDDDVIPLWGFIQLTLIGAILGGLMAAGFDRWATRARAWFVTTTIVLTALSCIPSVAMPPDAATQVVLVATHLVAAGIIIPALARHLRR